MPAWKYFLFLMVPVFLLVSFFTTSSFAGNNKHGQWKKEQKSAYKNLGNENHRDWRNEIRYSQGHHNDCNLPPGLAKKGKVPPGWAKKCNRQGSKQHAKKHQEHYPDHDHKRTSGGHNKPSIEGGIDIGVGIHIPFP